MEPRGLFDKFLTTDWSATEELKETIRSLFLGEINLPSDFNCEICIKPIKGGSEKVLFNNEMVGVILQTLLVPQIELCELKRALTLCSDCSCLFTTIIDLFLNLDALKYEYNNLRATIAKRIICESLNRPVSEWKKWKEELRIIEDFKENGLKYLITINTQLKRKSQVRKI